MTRSLSTPPKEVAQRGFHRKRNLSKERLRPIASTTQQSQTSEESDEAGTDHEDPGIASRGFVASTMKEKTLAMRSRSSFSQSVGASGVSSMPAHIAPVGAAINQKLHQIQEDSASREQRLVEKYNLPKIEADAKVDTNRCGRANAMAGLKPGDLEQELVRRVIKGDQDWVCNCLAKTGKDVLFSSWGGGITRTCILYAANRADIEMCKLLLRYGGKELLTFKDIKNRDVAYYANKHGFDIASLKGMGQGLVDCWNYKVLLKNNQTQSNQTNTRSSNSTRNRSGVHGGGSKLYSDDGPSGRNNNHGHLVADNSSSSLNADNYNNGNNTVKENKMSLSSCNTNNILNSVGEASAGAPNSTASSSMYNHNSGGGNSDDNNYTSYDKDTSCGGTSGSNTSSFYGGESSMSSSGGGHHDIKSTNSSSSKVDKERRSSSKKSKKSSKKTSKDPEGGSNKMNTSSSTDLHQENPLSREAIEERSYAQRISRALGEQPKYETDFDPSSPRNALLEQYGRKKKYRENNPNKAYSGRVDAVKLPTLPAKKKNGSSKKL